MKPRDIDVFGKGGRHALENRISDFAGIIGSVDTRQMTALDIGAAEGDISLWLADRFRHVTAIEYMDRAFARLSSRAAKHTNVTAIHADAAKFSFAESYDFVFLLGVLHYYRSDDAKARLLDACLGAARIACLVRTGIREHKQRDGWATERLNRFTPLSLYERAAEEHAADLFIADNAYRGRQEDRLGDLAIFLKRGADTPMRHAIGAAVEMLRSSIQT